MSTCSGCDLIRSQGSVRYGTSFEEVFFVIVSERKRERVLTPHHTLVNLFRNDAWCNDAGQLIRCEIGWNHEELVESICIALLIVTGADLNLFKCFNWRTDHSSSHEIDPESGSHQISPDFFILNERKPRSIQMWCQVKLTNLLSTIFFLEAGVGVVGKLVSIVFVLLLSVSVSLFMLKRFVWWEDNGVEATKAIASLSYSVGW